MNYLLSLLKRITTGIIVGIGIAIGLTLWFAFGVTHTTIKPPDVKIAPYMPEVKVATEFEETESEKHLLLTLSSLSKEKSNEFRVAVEFNDKNQITHGWCTSNEQFNLAPNQSLNISLPCTLLRSYYENPMLKQYLVINSGYFKRKIPITSKGSG